MKTILKYGKVFLSFCGFFIIKENGSRVYFKEFFTVHNKIAFGIFWWCHCIILLYTAIKYGADIKPYFIKTAFQPEFELEDAMKLASQLDVEPEIIRIDVLQNEKVTKNPKNRCYFCKNTLFSILREKADAQGRTLIDGTNYSDDAGDETRNESVKRNECSFSFKRM